MDFDDLVTGREPPPNRVRKRDGELEFHLYEGAVMVAYAMYLMRAYGIQHVRIHPDGEHASQFDFAIWLSRRGFGRVSGLGTTTYGGIYQNAIDQRITLNPKSGLGDVVADLNGHVISAECKGGILNTRHPGQLSRLEKGLCETVGRLMAATVTGRQVAVVPLTDRTFRLAERLAPRCARAGIEIALVGARGEVIEIGSKQESAIEGRNVTAGRSGE